MDIFLLDDKDPLLIDTYLSMIWTDRYAVAGDFELFMPIIKDLFKYVKLGKQEEDVFLKRRGSEHVMIIESVNLKTDTEEGDRVIIKGQSLESMLNRRVLWHLTVISGNLQEAIRSLIYACFIDPEDTDRKDPDFIFETTEDPMVTDLTIDDLNEFGGKQYAIGENLYDIICALCKEFGIGFSMTLNAQNKVVFKLYSGVDRSHAQTRNPYVVFSPKYDNLVDSEYLESVTNYKNVTLVGGEQLTLESGDPAPRKFAIAGYGVGRKRREMFTDANDISSNLGPQEEGGEDVIVDEKTYLGMLVEKGYEDLKEHPFITLFDGMASAAITYIYGVHFSIGDVVQVADAYGHSSRARVSEVIMAVDKKNQGLYPTFEKINDESEDESA